MVSSGLSGAGPERQAGGWTKEPRMLLPLSSGKPQDLTPRLYWGKGAHPASVSQETAPRPSFKAHPRKATRTGGLVPGRGLWLAPG